MKELVEKIKAMEADMKNLNVLAIRTSINNRISVQVDFFKDVPTVTGTTYTKRDSDYLQYEKSVVIDGVEICAVGTEDEMRREFTEVA